MKHATTPHMPHRLNAPHAQHAPRAATQAARATRAASSACAGLATLAVAAALLCLGPRQAAAQAINFAQTPLYLTGTIKPNLLVVLDNSQSMDGTMAGKLIAGDDATTRGNIARSVLRNSITSFRSAFRWGLASFGLVDTNLLTTYAYYFGSDAQMVYTNDCVGGISATNANLRCVPNPQNGNGFNFITYAQSGDDPSINDVLYSGDFGGQGYGVGINNSTSYHVYTSHEAGTGWNRADFSGGQGTWLFTPTDAGFTPATPPNRRMMWLRRAWGYYSDITGSGVLNRAVQNDSETHYNALMGLLGTETNVNGSAELKNAALFTPLAGTLDTVKSYFAGSLAGNGTPITDSCQRNFVLLATDGNPTGKTDGSMYTLDQIANTYSAATGSWTYGTAASDVFNRITSLRSTTSNGRSYDVQTYVIGLGDSVANASSVAALNRMAVLGGTDNAFLANNATALANAFRAVSVDIMARTAASSSVSLNSGSWSAGTHIYQGRYSSGDWSGQLLAFPVAENGDPQTTPDWDAGQRVNAQNWNSGRQIISYNPSAGLGARGVPFRWPANAASPALTEINAGMVAALNTSSSGAADGFGSQRLEFIRGNTALEDRNCSGCAAPVFRNRTVSVLGDIINSSPVYVGGATSDYRDTMETARYSSFGTVRRSATAAIYVGANDGMLHAFNAANGNELFAYVPYAVRSRLSGLTTVPFTHYYSVDGSPAVGDVYYGDAWHTLLVAGMGAGAPGLFALDVSNPGNFTEAKAALVARWEIGDADIGYIFGRALLAKMRDNKWRAIVGNGYNSTNGHAVLLLVDLETGAVTKLDTLAGTSSAPNGLSAVTAVSRKDDGVVDFVYAGDLSGKLWKFDVSGSAASTWTVAYGTSTAPAPLFTTASGQPITGRPGVTKMAQGGMMVTFGTGRYLDAGDNASSSGQTLYGIRDNGSTVAMSDLQTQSVASTTSSGGNTYRLTTHAVGPATDTSISGDNAISAADYFTGKKGWKLSLPDSGERIVSEPVVRYGRVVVSTLIPSSAACAAGGDGWVLELDLATGNRSAAMDVNADNTVDGTDLINGTAPSGVKIGAVPAAPSVMRSSVRKYDDYYINTSDGTQKRIHANGNSNVSRRAAWEQLQ